MYASESTQRTLALCAAVTAGATVAAAIAWLLHTLLMHGQAQTFDTMIYARALWGIAHFDWYNPTVGVNSLGVHAHWGLLVLAPLARFVEPAIVLLLAQALAAGVCAALLGWACGKVAARHGVARWPIALWGAIAGVISSPLIINPFLFDARPDMLAVPLLFGAFVRVLQTRRLDRVSAALMLCAVLMREELAMTVVPAFLFIPTGERWSVRAGLRVSGAVLALLYWGGYWFVLRELLGGSGASDRVDDSATVFLGSGGAAAWFSTAISLARWKVEMGLAAGATLGGLALLGNWRWWLIAGPGLLFVVLPNRFPELALNFHYSFLVAPALLAAGVDGLDRLLRIATTPTRRAAASVMIAAVSIAAFLASSAFPGGGRFQTAWFFPDRASGANPTAAVYDVLESIPPEASLAVSYVLGAPFCDREFIESDVQLVARLRRDTTSAFEPDFVALHPQRAESTRSVLVNVFGYTETNAVPGRLILFTRNPEPEN